VQINGDATVTAERSYAFAGTMMTVLVEGEQTGGAFAVLHVIKPNSSSTPPHSHDAETEVVYPLSGSVGVESGGHIRRFGKGEAILPPPGRPHRLFNDSGGQAREFLVCAPAAFDRFVAATGMAVPPGSEPVPMTDEDRQRFIAKAPEFGIRLLRTTATERDADAPAVAPVEKIDVLGLRLEVLARLETGAGSLVLLSGVMPPGHFVQLHSQPDPGCLLVGDGSLAFYSSDDGWRGIDAEEAVPLEPHRQQALRNASSAPTHFLLVTTSRMLEYLIVTVSPGIGSPQ
jgi:quercetin dioxygenase-like cupin family protein